MSFVLKFTERKKGLSQYEVSGKAGEELGTLRNRKKNLLRGYICSRSQKRPVANLVAKGEVMTGSSNNGPQEAGGLRGTEGEEFTWRQEWQWRKGRLVVGQPMG